MKFKIETLDIVLAFAIALLICLATGAANAQTSTGYANAQTPIAVQMATVMQVRAVTLDASQQSKAVSGIVGGAVGALLAARVNKGSNNPNGYVITTVLGSLGALGGALVADGMATTRSQEIVYAQDDGRAFAVTQSLSDGVSFTPGQRVMVLNGRVIPAMAPLTSPVTGFQHN